VVQELGEVKEKGYQGRNGGWRTAAQRAASAWIRQYETQPENLDPKERRAYEADPSSLQNTILDANSPFRDYREAWIGAWRAGEDVEGAADFDSPDYRGEAVTARAAPEATTPGRH